MSNVKLFISFKKHAKMVNRVSADSSSAEAVLELRCGVRDVKMILSSMGKETHQRQSKFDPRYKTETVLRLITVI